MKHITKGGADESPLLPSELKSERSVSNSDHPVISLVTISTGL